MATPIRPFGGGTNICPGRFFALAEFRIVLEVLLAQCEFELLGDVPEANARRTLTGSVPPVKDVRVRKAR